MNFRKFLQSKCAILLPVLMICATLSVVTPGAKATTVDTTETSGLVRVDCQYQQQAYWANESGKGGGGGHRNAGAGGAMAPPRTDE